MLLRFVLDDEARRKKLSLGAYATGAEEATSDIDRERKKKSKSRGVVESNPRPSTAYYYSSYTFQVPSCAAEQQVLQR